MANSLRVLGIDPGFDRVGFGVIDQRGNDANWVHHSCLQTLKTDDFATRLQQTHKETIRIIKEFQPACVAVEQLFFQTNVKTAIKVGMARGVILLAIADAHLPLVELTPNQVKQGMTGWGGAEKSGIQEMVKRFLRLKEIPKPDDAADALAIAVVGGLIFRQEYAHPTISAFSKK
ncbi:MAG TPA: crossover junction endodeoxyribonuclease RuvC [Patescibacteria group bacterium]|nr:crossover junction endodeoxyribonuclease RuvC [Patescibacteria group bacterium]